MRKRSQLENPITGTMTKRDRTSGQFVAVKKDGGKFKGMRRER